MDENSRGNSRSNSWGLEQQEDSEYEEGQIERHLAGSSGNTGTRRQASVVDRAEWGRYLEFAPPVLPVAVADDTEADPLLVSELLRANNQLGHNVHNDEHADDSGSESESSGAHASPNKVVRQRHGNGRWKSKLLSHAPSLLQHVLFSSFFSPSRTTSSSSTSSISGGPRRKHKTLHNLQVGQSSESTGAMPITIKTHWWITAWFLVTTPVIFWDVGYCLMRPRSMVGGDLHWIWTPYALYQEVDYVYGVKALQENNGFTSAQAFMNIIETLLNLYYVYQAHIVKAPSAALIGFASAVMTLSKTILYWAQEGFCGGCAVGHNSWNDLILLWVIPNGLWILVPSLIVWQFAKDISGGLKFAAKRSSGKTQ